MKTLILEAILQTRNTVQKKSYLLKLATIILKIEDELINNEYTPKQFSCFAVKDPKIREIFSPNYQDRIIHHLVVNPLEKIIDPQFIFDSCANRKNKGCQFAVKRLQDFIRSNKTEYYLQLDIKSFFTSINKNILFKIIKQHIDKSQILLPEFDEQRQLSKNELITLCKSIIFHNPTEPEPIFTGNKNLLKLVPKHKSLFACPKDTGLPIGSLTSQFFANVYLNELDQFVKHNLKAKYYLRYVDDLILLSDCKEQLKEWQKQIDLFLQTKLKLYLHPNKVKLQHKSKGIDFLGYIVYKNNFLVRPRVIKNFKRRLYFFNHLLDPIKFPIADPPPILKISQQYRNKEINPPIKPDLSLLHKMLATINVSYY